MAEYIEREALLKEMLDFHSIPVYIGHVSDEDIMFENMVEFVKEQPTADVVEVVRCKDCKYFEIDEEDELGECKCGNMAMSYCGVLYPQRNDFCRYGERKCDK